MKQRLKDKISWMTAEERKLAATAIKLLADQLRLTLVIFGDDQDD